MALKIDLLAMRNRGFIVLGVLAVGLLAEIASCTVTVVPLFWLRLLSDAYYVGVLFAAVNFGVIGGLAAAGIAGAFHAVAAASVCFQPEEEQRTLAILAIIAVVAGWLTR